MQLIEPQRGVNLIQSMNTRVSSSQFLFSVVSILADVLVFFFPIFLIAVYIVGIKKKSDTYKMYTLRIFSSTIIAGIINIIIQYFFLKARPETVLEGTGGLLLKHLPTMSFPSDHAAVSMAFGIATFYFIKLLTGKKTQKILQGWGIFFIIGSIIMSLARVAVGVHWPTDIIAGWVVGIIAVSVTAYIPKVFLNRIIDLEKKMTSLFLK